MSIVSPARKCLKLEYCINAFESRSHPSGPNIIIELNFWHAQQLAGLLQDFSACAVEVEHPIYGTPMKSLERGSKSEQAMCELYLHLKACIDEYAS